MTERKSKFAKSLKARKKISHIRNFISNNFANAAKKNVFPFIHISRNASNTVDFMY